MRRVDCRVTGFLGNLFGYVLATTIQQLPASGHHTLRNSKRDDAGTAVVEVPNWPELDAAFVPQGVDLLVRLDAHPYRYHTILF